MTFADVPFTSIFWVSWVSGATGAVGQIKEYWKTRKINQG